MAIKVTTGPKALWRPDFLLTPTGLKRKLLALQNKYPDLIQVKVIGKSGETVAGKADRDILLVTLTNKKVHGQKPITSFVGGIHPREIFNPAMLLEWIEQLASLHGTDAHATALLNSRQVDVIAMLNPDGLAKVNEGFDKQDPKLTQWMKTTSSPEGVNINLNCDEFWGGAGSSPDPFDMAYRGPFPASEVETQVLQKYLLDRKPDLYLDVHSWNGSVLYPWAHSPEKSKDQEAHKTIAADIASRAGYRAIPAIELEPASGNSSDFAYEKLGIPSFTVETSVTNEYTDENYVKAKAESLPMFTRAVQIADAPAERVQGPTMKSVFTWFDPSDPASGIGAGAIANDLRSGGDKVVAAEAVLDPSAPPGSGVQLEPDGAFDSPEKFVFAQLPEEFMAQAKVLDVKGPYKRLIYLRAKDDKGNWGVAVPLWLDAVATP